LYKLLFSIFVKGKDKNKVKVENWSI